MALTKLGNLKRHVPTGVADGNIKSKKVKDKSHKINVEFTASDGGKGEDRREKIKVENERLKE